MSTIKKLDRTDNMVFNGSTLIATGIVLVVEAFLVYTQCLPAGVFETTAGAIAGYWFGDGRFYRKDQ